MSDTTKMKKAFIFGFVALILCGVGDWLMGYEPAGGEELIFGITRTSIVFVPTSMSIIAKIIGAVLVAVGSPLSFLTACGESWGWGFMCLAFYAVVVKEEKKSKNTCNVFGIAPSNLWKS